MNDFGSAYDYKTTNSYDWSKLGDNTNVNGFNYNTGSHWFTTIKPNGTMTGTDANSHAWTYDSNTGNYLIMEQVKVV